ncbi:hypothetical protein POVWA1_002580 [Plasmodium ovale wallikeri]|uniref:Secreted protein n=1 Tax=Plasmodium ovale wallikeri TaxID=864142 RepID=A0A1A8YGB5_PLAOA|nr:hypothetical protein POVWA1_002580 [Plasmodium ovale wallikeri]
MLCVLCPLCPLCPLCSTTNYQMFQHICKFKLGKICPRVSLSFFQCVWVYVIFACRPFLPRVDSARGVVLYMATLIRCN